MEEGVTDPLSPHPTEDSSSLFHWVLLGTLGGEVWEVFV